MISKINLQCGQVHFIFEVYLQKNRLMNNKEDEQFRIWSEQIRDANQNAFNDLFRYLYPKLVRFAMRYTKQKEDACDVVQDTFVALWRKKMSWIRSSHCKLTYLKQ